MRCAEIAPRLELHHGYDHDSCHCRSRSAAWRRRLIRPWTLVRTLIPSSHRAGADSLTKRCSAKPYSSRCSAVSMTWLSTRSSEMGPVALQYEELLLEVAPMLTSSPLASRRTWRTRSFLSLLGFLSVLVLAAALHVIGTIKSA